MRAFWNMIKFGAAGIVLGSQMSCADPDNIEVKQLGTQLFLLGESPWWDANRQELAMIDIEAGRLAIFSGDGQRLRQHPLQGKPGTVIPTDKNNYLIAIGNAVVIFSERDGIIDTLASGQFSTDTLRFNDGKVAPGGAFWVGTVECQTYSQPKASLYRLNDRTLEPQLSGITVSNGISWSLDGRIMYYIDSPTRTVKAYDYDTATNTISNGRIIIRTPEDWGTPDGCCIDSHGNLWVAQWGGACVALWDTKSGCMIRKISVPAKNVTAVALGGQDMDQLFITTASIAMDDADTARYPLAGGVFTCHVPTPGLLRTKWKEQ